MNGVGVRGLLARILGRGRRPGASGRRARDLGRHAETLTIPDVEGRSGAILRPSGITYDVGEEFEAYATELSRREDAAGVAASRTATTRAAGLGPQADAARHLTSTHSPEVQRAIDAYSTAQDDLVPFVRRRPKDGRRYSATRWVLGLGDIAAVLGAAIYMGEVPIIAVGQAVAAGLAAVTAGMVGADVRERWMAGNRQELVLAELVDPCIIQRHPRLFGPTRDNEATYGLALKLALLITVLLGVSIFALRASIEGLAGIVFGGLAVATALASFINSWAYGDDVADVLEVFDERLNMALHRQQTLAGAPQPSAQDAHAAQATSIQTEHEIRGQAKAAGVRALKYEVFRRHPQIFGHGLAEFRTARLIVDREVSEPFETSERPRAGIAGVGNTFQSNGHPPS